MDFRKKFDYNDINNFLPDNQTVGTSDFYRDKFKLKFPDQFYEMFEIMARSEYSHDESIELIEKAKKDLRESNQKLIDEWNQRNPEGNERQTDLSDNKLDLSNNTLDELP